MIVILGGMGTLYGPILGAFAFGFLQDYIQELWSDHWLLLLGTFIITVVLFLPNGIAGLLSQITNKEENQK